MINAYTGILIEARRSILAEGAGDPLSRDIANDLTVIINALGILERRTAKNESLYRV